jgi:hypothetical protein
MKSVMQNRFSQAPQAEVARSRFDRSHGRKSTFDSGYLVPILVDEALPGDTISCRMSGFARLATPLKAPMDNVHMETFFFAVPNRLVWDNWQKFNGEQVDPGDSIDYTIPQMTSPGGGYSNESLSDYLGIPTEVAGLAHSALFHRAYNLIYNEWFRDQNLQDSVVVDTGDGPDDPSDYVLLRRGKRHDYFTSCLPWPQKGDSVSLPLGTTAEVIYQNDSSKAQLVRDKADGSLSSGADLRVAGAAGVFEQTDGTDVHLDPNSTLYADLSNATAATINELRQAFQIQKMLERDARGGTRYIEVIRSHFGVISPDARVQRPEYLGGGHSPVYVHPVAQTSESNTTNQGNIASFGTASISGHGFTKSFTEHCIIIGLVNVRADLTYQQGMDRMFSRLTRYDFYWPALAHIGEQAVLNKEIYADASANDDAVFGYQERYAEYRYKPSTITGKFRSNDALSLDVWHLAQDFGSLPSLNASFMVDQPPIDRIVAAPTEPEFLFDSYFDYQHARPMPVYGVPGMIDHF